MINTQKYSSEKPDPRTSQIYESSLNDINSLENKLETYISAEHKSKNVIAKTVDSVQAQYAFSPLLCGNI